ncbi:MAG TPA: thiamine-phosphate kinase, partial [Actinomycetes bacterium]|nr:thiamine-phosphate kinase [Actinomycetes bacterium]
LKAAPSATAMCDVSDGLLADAGRIARASEKVIDIETECLDVAEPIAAVASAYGIDPLKWVLSGGEDHAFVATFPANKRLPRGFVRVGQVRDAADGDVPVSRVTVDGAPWPGDAGYAHFTRTPN